MAGPEPTGREKRKRREPFDYSLLLVVLILVGFGLVMLYSTSSWNGQVKFADKAYYLKKQFFATSLGLAAMYAVSKIDYHRWERLAVPGYLLSLLLSTAVLFFGDEYNGFEAVALGGAAVLPALGIRQAFGDCAAGLGGQPPGAEMTSLRQMFLVMLLQSSAA